MTDSKNDESELTLLSELVLGLSSVALHYLGEISYVDDHSLMHTNLPKEIGDDKSTNSSESSKNINLELARQNIDFIVTISEKTKGNLTKSERKIIDTTLQELQDLYEEKKKFQQI